MQRSERLELKVKGNRPTVVHTCDDCQALTDGFRVSSIAFAFRLRLGDRGRGTIKMRILGIVALGAAVVIFWPAAFFVGGDKQTAAELAQMKGQMVAIEQEANMKRCGIQFQGPRPPGT